MMKKTFSRVLSLLLVLAITLSVIPAVFAVEADTVSAKSMSVNSTDVTVKVGQTHQISVTGMTLTSGEKLSPNEISVEFKTDDPRGLVKITPSGQIVALKAGTTEIQVVGKGTRAGWDLIHVAVVPVVITVIDGSEDLLPDVDEPDAEDAVVTYSVDVKPASLSLAVGEVSDPLSVVVTKIVDGKESVLPASAYTVDDWIAAKVDGKDIVEVDTAGKVTGIVSGVTVIEAIVFLNGEDVERVGTCQVTVGDGAGPDESPEDDDTEAGSEQAFRIESFGTVLGPVYADAISEAYQAATGKELGYVIFDRPAANSGKLYSKVSYSGGSIKVAESNELKSGDKLWYSSKSASNLKLSDAAFIPAAGFKGTAELTYTAYDANGQNPHNGTISFVVAAKKASAYFTDVNAASYAWAADSADFLYQEGVAKGSGGKYNPAANITRQDFMLMLYRAFLAKEYGAAEVTDNFSDVVKGADAYSKEIYQAVGVARSLGIAKGSNGKFNPKSNITRQDAMVLIYRTLDIIGKDLEYSVSANVSAFRDYGSISSYALEGITYLVSHGVIQGSNNQIKPTANITRAEMACILHRVLTY